MSNYNPPFRNLNESAKGLFPLGLTIACALTLMILEYAQFTDDQKTVYHIPFEDEFPIEIDLKREIIFYEVLMKKKKNSGKKKATNDPLRKVIDMTPLARNSHSAGIVIIKKHNTPLGLSIDTLGKETYSMGELNLDSYPYFNSCYNPDDRIAQFKCTRQMLQDIIRDNVKYPQIDHHILKNGTVVIGFTINKCGVVSDLAVTRSASKSMDKAALNALINVPKFVPGKQNGRPINVRFQVPITFKNQ